MVIVVKTAEFDEEASPVLEAAFQYKYPTRPK
jgi:hypothetical protein